MWLLLASLASADPAPPSAWVGLGVGTAAPVLLGMAIGSAGVDKPDASSDAFPKVGTPAYYQAHQRWKRAQDRVIAGGTLGFVGLVTGPPLLASGALSARGDAPPTAGYLAWGLWGGAMAGTTASVVIMGTDKNDALGGGLFLASGLMYVGAMSAGVAQLVANGKAGGTEGQTVTLMVPAVSGRF